jgi:hypothetical protein
MTKLTLDDYNEEVVPSLVGIDRHNLEIEVSHISRMVYNYGIFLADAEDTMDRAKVRWQRSRKELCNTVRDNPSEYGLPSYGRGPSNDQVWEVVDNNKDIIELEDKYLDAKHIFNRVNAAVEAFSTKRFSLAWALKLWSQNYYADVPVDEKTRERMMESSNYAKVYEELTEIAKKRRQK